MSAASERERMNQKWIAVLVALIPAAAWLIFSLADRPLAKVTLLDLIILVALWLSGGFVWFAALLVQSFIETRGKARGD